MGTSALVALLLAWAGRAAALRKGPCDGTHAKSSWCNPSSSLPGRAAALVAELQTSEKALLLENTARAIPRLDIPAYDWWNEAVHGFARVQFGNGTDIHVNATSFPMSIGVSSAFNRSLWREVGAVVGREARGAANADMYGLNALTFWAPNINIARDSRWGRNQETPGEDPLTNGEYAVALAAGMQGDHPEYLQISACAKHFAVHSWNTPSHYMAYPTPQDLHDTYLPAFEAAVRGNISGVMCSYNGVNGYPMCANKELLGKLRAEWSFNGYVTSDCGAVGPPLYPQYGLGSTVDMITKSLAAGLDSDCGNGHDGVFTSDTLLPLLVNGTVPMELVDSALTHLLLVQFRLGMFDSPSTLKAKGASWATLGRDAINTAENREIVFQAAAQGLVLLKNTKEPSGLPLTPGKTIALVGPNVQNVVTHDCGPRKMPSYLGCEGCYCGNPIDPVSPLAGFARYAGATTHVQGCSIAGNSTEGFAAAKRAASQADETVLIVGLDVTQECEGLDRTTVKVHLHRCGANGRISGSQLLRTDHSQMPGVQTQLVLEVCAAAKPKPCIVLLMAGSAVDTYEIEVEPAVSAVMWVGYPGERGGEAIAAAVYGKTDTFGRLSFSMYKAAYYDTGLSPLDFSMRPNKTTHNPGRTYRFYEGPLMLHPFGFGLRYAEWSIISVISSRTILTRNELRVGLATGRATPLFDVEVTARHSGVSVASLKQPSANVLMLFAAPPDTANLFQIGQPLKTLVGFERVLAKPMEAITCHMRIHPHQLSLVDEYGQHQVVDGEWKLSVEQQIAIVTVAA